MPSYTVGTVVRGTGWLGRQEVLCISVSQWMSLNMKCRLRIADIGPLTLLFCSGDLPSYRFSFFSFHLFLLVVCLGISRTNADRELPVSVVSWYQIEPDNPNAPTQDGVYSLRYEGEREGQERERERKGVFNINQTIGTGRVEYISMQRHSKEADRYLNDSVIICSKRQLRP